MLSAATPVPIVANAGETPPKFCTGQNCLADQAKAVEPCMGLDCEPPGTANMQECSGQDCLPIPDQTAPEPQDLKVQPTPEGGKPAPGPDDGKAQPVPQDPKAKAQKP